jgi:hypothetical protein
MTDRYVEPLKLLRATALANRTEHEKWCGRDGKLYNGGTIVILFCNVAATALPTAIDGWGFWLPKALLIIATFGIALERSKSYGLRWQFHIGKKNQWASLIDQIDIFPAWPDADKDEKFKALVADVASLRSSEGSIPGTGPVDVQKPV